MQSSTDISKVRLPSFLEMMRAMGDGTVSVSDGADTEDGAPQDSARAKSVYELETEEELRKTKEICTGMRKEALAEIDKLLDQAMREAVSIREKARRDITEELTQKARLESESLRSSVKKAVRTLEEETALLYTALEPRLLDLTMHICESILQYELCRDENAYISIIRNALNIVRSDGHGRTLRLPAQAYSRLIGDDASTDFARQLTDMGVTITRDVSVTEGDCLVEGHIGGVRAGAASQLSRLFYAITKENE